MKERIKKIRKDKKLSQVEFGNKLSVSRDAIANIECGRVDPKPLFICLLYTSDIYKPLMISS